MATLLKKVARRIKGPKTQPDVSCYTERGRTPNKPDQLIRRREYTSQEPLPIHEEDISYRAIERQEGKHLSQNRLKLWSNKLRKVVRTNRVPSHQWDRPISKLPLESIKPIRLLSSNASSCTAGSYPKSPSPELDTDNIVQPTLSQSTAEVESEFGFTMQRIRRESGQQTPRLYLDMARQSNTFSPFRPFSPGILLPNGGHDQPTPDPAPLFRCFSTTGSRYPSDTLSPSVGNRFYSKANLEALGVNRAVTVDSRLSTAARNPFAPSSGRNTPSLKSSNTTRSLSGTLFSLSIVSSRKNSVESTSASRNTTPSFPIVSSPTSFC